MISTKRVRKLFEGLQNGDGVAFFEHVADDVDCAEIGTRRTIRGIHDKAIERRRTRKRLIGTGSTSDLGLNSRWRQRETERDNGKALKHCVLVTSIESRCSLRSRSLALPVLLRALERSLTSESCID